LVFVSGFISVSFKIFAAVDDVLITFLTHAGGSLGVGSVTSCVCLSICPIVRAHKRKAAHAINTKLGTQLHIC